MKFKDLNKIKNGIVKIGTTIILIFSISLNSIFISFGNINYSNNTQILNEVNEEVKTQNGFTLLENAKEVLLALKPDVCIITTMSLLKDCKEALVLCASLGINAITTCEEAFYSANSNPNPLLTSSF